MNIAFLLAFALAPAGAASDAAHFNRAPFLQQLTAESVVIASQSVAPCVASVRYGAVGSPMVEEVVEPSERFSHVIRLSGLSPQTRYRYTVYHADRNWGERSFTTLPVPGQGPVVIGVWGDSGLAGEGQLGVREILEDLTPAVLLHTGDLAYPIGSPLGLQVRFFAVYEELLSGSCVYPVAGNHDLTVSLADAFELPTNGPGNDELNYSFDAGDAHLVALDSNPATFSDELLAWLEADLRASQRAWKIVFFHHPPYGTTRHGGALWVRQAIVPILESCRVDLVLNGHEHAYERFYPIFRGRIVGGFQNPAFTDPGGPVYVITGGGGGGLYAQGETPDPGAEFSPHLSAVFRSAHHAVGVTVNRDEIAVRAIGGGGELLDAFTLRHGAAPPPAFRCVMGDANESGRLTLSDGVAILRFLFVGQMEVCNATADVDGSGRVEVTDAIRLLGYLFQGQGSPTIGHCVELIDPDTTGCLGPRCP